MAGVSQSTGEEVTCCLIDDDDFSDPLGPSRGLLVGLGLTLPFWLVLAWLVGSRP